MTRNFIYFFSKEEKIVFYELKFNFFGLPEEKFKYWELSYL